MSCPTHEVVGVGFSRLVKESSSWRADIAVSLGVVSAGIKHTGNFSVNLKRPQFHSFDFLVGKRCFGVRLRLRSVLRRCSVDADECMLVVVVCACKRSFSRVTMHTSLPDVSS